MPNPARTVADTAWTERTRRNSTQDWADAQSESHHGNEYLYEEALKRATAYNEALGWKKVRINRTAPPVVY